MAGRSPLTAVPALRSSLPLLRVRRRAVLIALIAAAGLGVVSAVVTMTRPAGGVTQVIASDSQAAALARIAALDYLAARDTSVGAAAGVDTRFSTRNVPLAIADLAYSSSSRHQMGDLVQAQFEEVKFRVALAGTDSAAGGLLDLTVPMLKTSAGWVLAALPSIAPAQAASTTQAVEYSDLFQEGGTAGDLGQEPTWGAAAVSQVERWAQAYASEGANSKALFDLTGDRDSTHSYAGLGGWTASKVTVTSYTKGPNNDERSSTFGSMWVAVRVHLVLTSSAANGPTLSADYDLLLEPGMNPASPPVTAWGPAGVGPASLIDYSNATTAG